MATNSNNALGSGPNANANNSKMKNQTDRMTNVENMSNAFGSDPNANADNSKMKNQTDRMEEFSTYQKVKNAFFQHDGTRFFFYHKME